MSTLPIYLDNQATTRCDPRVLEAMLPYFREDYGNASSRHHAYGQRARAAVDTAREQVAALVGARPREIIFTSGATESNNLALKGPVGIPRDQPHHLVTVVTEHKAVLDPCRRLEHQGCRLTVLPVDHEGYVSSAQIAEVLTPQTLLVSVMAANNEVGTLQPIEDIGRLCKERGVLFHCDATQAAGKIPLDVETLGVDLMSLSGHKMYGPKGIGVLYVRSSGPHVRLTSLFEGGGHERGMRSGTLNVPGIVGMGMACVLAREELTSETARVTELREHLWNHLRSELEDVFLNGPTTSRLPGNLSVSFAHVDGNALLMNLRGVAVSSGSACTSGDPQPSYVLRALGVSEERALSTLRFGLGRFTTKNEIDQASAEIVSVVRKLRALSPSYAMAQRGRHQGAHRAPEMSTKEVSRP